MYFCAVVVTLYATLGEEAIIHGISETECSIVITSSELLPKFQVLLSVRTSVVWWQSLNAIVLLCSALASLLLRQALWLIVICLWQSSSFSPPMAASEPCVSTGHGFGSKTVWTAVYVKCHCLHIKDIVLLTYWLAYLLTVVSSCGSLVCAL